MHPNSFGRTFQPVRLLFLPKFPARTLIWTCTFIWTPRVHVQHKTQRYITHWNHQSFHQLSLTIDDFDCGKKSVNPVVYIIYIIQEQK